MSTTTHRKLSIKKTSPHRQLSPVPMASVRWTKGFWANRFKNNSEVSLPHLWNRLAAPEGGHVLQNLRIAAGLDKGKFAGESWADEWMAKWIESAIVIQTYTGNKELERQIDEAIDLVAKVQCPDGYLASQTVVSGEKRFTDPHDHELYTMGHMITAAVLHHRLTGKTNFLDIACKIGDYVCQLYAGEVSRHMIYFPFNPSIIMAMVDLYRETGEQKYLDAAQGFVDRRGSAPRQQEDKLLHDWMGGDLCQDRIPLREETEMVGHSVLSTYLYCGAADIVAETGELALLDALKKIWHDFTTRKRFINGGACAVPMGVSNRKAGGLHVDVIHEATGPEYYLPNALSYNETCAQVGVFMWGQRMTELEPASSYADIMEETLYAGILSGVQLDGASWFYRNILRWHGGETHPYKEEHCRCTCTRFQPGREAICCPTNLLRTIAQFHGYLYSTSNNALWVHHYGANTLNTALANGQIIALDQETNYPWDGRISMTLKQASNDPFEIRLRIPKWAVGATLKINSKDAGVDLAHGTYASIKRRWAAGDVLELDLPMTPRVLVAHPLIEELRNQVAVMRGPMLYCLEEHDIPQNMPLHEVHLPRDVKLTPRHLPDELQGITVLEGTAKRFVQGQWGDDLYKTWPGSQAELTPIRLIPYYAWANRGPAAMSVWLSACD